MMNHWLRRAAMATLLASFLPGPSIINAGPASINVFDTLFLVSCALFLIGISLQRRFYLRLNGVSAFGLLYPSVIVLASLSGALLYGYPLGYIVGDIRWLQAIVLSAILFNTYRYSYSIVEDFRYVVYIGIAINAAFVVLQIMASLSGEPTRLLEWWYKDVPDTAGRPLGFHINRFSGAIGQPSSLGFFATISIGYALAIMKRSSVQLILMVGALLLLIASGSRTAMIAGACIILGYVVFLAGRDRIRYIFYLFIVLALALPIAISADLGRIADPDRYRMLIDIAFGEMQYHEAAARGDRWTGAVERRNQDHLLLGTLSNPSHVYSDLTVDSGYFHIFARLGPIGLFFVGIMLLAPGLAMLMRKKGKHILLTGIVFFTVAVMAINQNAFTSVPVKNILVFGLFLLSIKINLWSK